MAQLSCSHAETILELLATNRLWGANRRFGCDCRESAVLAWLESLLWHFGRFESEMRQRFLLPETSFSRTLCFSNPPCNCVPFMNVRAKGRKPNYRQMIVFGLMAVAVVYHFSRPTLEKWFGASLPSIVQNDDRGSDSDRGDDRDYNAKLPDADSNSGGGSSQSQNDSGLSPGQAARNWLQDIGRNKYKSPAGLIYGSGREHRIDHVLLHCKDNPSKPTHGVFVGDAVEVMKMVDEAYEMAKSGGGKVDTNKEGGGKVTHTCSMGRVVGHTGGKKAKRQGRKELRRIKLVLAGENVITAFPTN